jgi:hypothetical protein
LNNTVVSGRIITVAVTQVIFTLERNARKIAFEGISENSMPKVEEHNSFEKWFWLLLNQNLKKTIHSNYEALNHHICFFDFKNPLSKKDINFSFYDVFKNCWIK